MDSLEDILGGVEEEIRRAEERLRLDVPRPKPSRGTLARSSNKQPGCLAAPSTPVKAGSVGGGGGGTKSREEAATRRLLQNALLPERRAGREEKPCRRRARVGIENDYPDPTTAATSSDCGGSSEGEDAVCRSSIGTRSCRGRFRSSQEREAVVERLLRAREARWRSSAVAAGSAAPGTRVGRRRYASVSPTEAARDYSDVSSNGGGGVDGRVLEEEERQTRRRENLNDLNVEDDGGWRRSSRGGSRDGGGGAGVFDCLPRDIEGITKQDNVFFASDILGESTRRQGDIVLTRFENPNLPHGAFLSQGCHVYDSGQEEGGVSIVPAALESSHRSRGHDRGPCVPLSLSKGEGGTTSRDRHSRSRPYESRGGGGQQASSTPSVGMKSSRGCLSQESRGVEAGDRESGSGSSSKVRKTDPRYRRLGDERGVLIHCDRRTLSPPKATGDQELAGRGLAKDRRCKPDARAKEEGNRLAAVRRLEDLLSFRPKERCSSLQIVKEKQSSCGKSGGIGRRIEELARSRTAVYSERERLRKEQQLENETKECTFRPKITRAAAMATSRQNCTDGDDLNGLGSARLRPLHGRLHREAREREAARLLAQHHLEAKSLRECTFQPALTAVSAAAVEQRPLHQRLWEVEREREHKLRILQAKKEEQEGATFAPPPLGRVSQRLTRDVWGPGRGEDGGGAVVARLKEQTAWAKERRRLRLEEREEAEARISTFKPRISRGTESLVRRRPELGAPFEQRRAIMEAKSEERKHRRLAARAEEEHRWFNPPTARRTEALLRRHMPQRLEETVEQRVSRMASSENNRRREVVISQRAKERRECTFHPSLNPVTRSVGRASTLDELVNNRRGQRVRERALARVSDRDAKTCPHKPILLAEEALLREPPPPRQQQRYTSDIPSAWVEPRGCGGDGGSGSRDDEDAVAAVVGLDPEGLEPPRCAASLYGPGNKYRLNLREPGRMAADLRTRERQQEEKVCAMRLEQEAAEMRPCTFAPKTNDRVLRAQGPVLVRGLGRYLELKDVAQQQDEERREREARAFGVRPGAVRRTVLGETVLKPFSLSEGNKRGWWGDRRRRHVEERAAQCPFEPWTVEGERSKALSRLLECSSVLAGSAGCRKD